MLFWILWIINLLIFLVCLYETYAVSSNSSLAIPAFILAVLLVGSLWFRASNPKIAMVLIGIPAGLLLLFLVYYIIMAMTRSNWQ
jgi:hypothetical protein